MPRAIPREVPDIRQNGRGDIGWADPVPSGEAGEVFIAGGGWDPTTLTGVELTDGRAGGDNQIGELAVDFLAVDRPADDHLVIAPAMIGTESTVHGEGSAEVGNGERRDVRGESKNDSRIVKAFDGSADIPQ